jgi:copper chaperone CopZ
METLVLGIEGMRCGACAAKIEKLLYSLAGVESVAVSFDAGEAEISFDPRQITGAALATSVEQAGYGARLLCGSGAAMQAASAR